MIRHYIAIAAVGCVTLGPLWAQEDVTPPSADEMQQAMSSPQAFADRAASSNAFELASSELALERARSPEVRSFAEKMIADHTDAAEKMRAAAGEDGLILSDVIMPDHQAQLDSLASVEAADFDAAYLGAQLAAHTEAVMLFEGFAGQGRDSTLERLAAALLPTLQMHFAEVSRLNEV